MNDTVREPEPPQVGKKDHDAEFRNGVLFGESLERKRVAQELHDDICQRLSLVGLELSDVEQLVRTTGSPTAEQRLCIIRRYVESIALDVHRISHNLHPAALTHLGLVFALRDLCRDFAERARIDVEFTSDITLPLSSHELATSLYRVTQECLSNAARHSGSDRAQVALTERSGMLSLTITDHGVGFDIGLSSKMGLGLVNIRARARSVGGDVQITSAPGQGTTVTVQVPLNLMAGTQ